MNRMDPTAAFSDYVATVEAELTSWVGGNNPDDGDILVHAARHLCLGAGKRARPILVKIFADTVAIPSRRIVEAAVASELIHAASLLHDDVVDAGMFRRGRPTVNARWGNTVAVMAGDLLLSTALSHLAEVDGRLTASALRTVTEMTRAAIREVEVRGNLDLALSDLATIAEGKTGSLFGWCGIAAATLAENPDAARHFDAFGRRIGVAFQMADDIRDITGTDEGKPQYADIQSRTPSLPILLAVQKDEALKKRLRDAWGFVAITPERARELGLSVLVSGAVDESIERMNGAIDAAVDALGPYAQTKVGSNLVHWARKIAQGMALKGVA